MDALEQMLNEALDDKKREGKIEAYEAVIQFCRNQIDKLKIEEAHTYDRSDT